MPAVHKQAADFRCKALFQQYYRYVYAIVWERLRTAGTAQDAEECVSDVFAEVFRHLSEIHPDSMQAYIGTLARRKAVDAFRRLTAKKNPAPLDEDAFALMSSGEDIAADYEKHALHQLLLDKVCALGEPDTSIILQRYYYNRSTAEIAASLHMNPVTVRVRIGRALKKLRKLLEQEGISSS